MDANNFFFIKRIGGTAKFQYDRLAKNVIVTVGAVAFGKDIFAEEITSSPKCFDVYGMLPSPRHTVVDC